MLATERLVLARSFLLAQALAASTAASSAAETHCFCCHLPHLCRRSVLAGYLPGSPHPRSLVFGRNMHGKPALLGPHTTAGGHRLRFNLTHTGAMIGLAVTGGRGGQVGGGLRLEATGFRDRCCCAGLLCCLARSPCAAPCASMCSLID